MINVVGQGLGNSRYEIRNGPQESSLCFVSVALGYTEEMGMTFEAVYENGVLKPLESLALPNMQHVLVTISGVPATADDIADYFEPEEWEAAKHDDISLHKVRRALSSIPGSLADAVITSREER